MPDCRGFQIYIAIGANLPSPVHGDPLATCRASIPAMRDAGVDVVACSRWYRSRPVPRSEQPDYVNGAVRVATHLGPTELMVVLHSVERAFGRVRVRRNDARILDLDLLCYGDVVSEEGPGPVLPHPRLHERAFVLQPMADLAPAWCHPRFGVTVQQLLDALSPDQLAVPIADRGGPCAAPDETL